MDIVLVLLIIFMLTSTAIVKAAIKVDLPKAANSKETVSSTVNLVVTQEKELFLDGEPVSEKQAADIVRKRAAEAPSLQAVISADKQLAYGDVVSIIDLVKGSGVKTFALNIEKQLAEQ